MDSSLVTVVAVFDRRVFYEYMETVGIGIVTGWNDARTEFDVQMIYTLGRSKELGESGQLILNRVDRSKLVFLGGCHQNEVKDRLLGMFLDKLEKCKRHMKSLQSLGDAALREFQPGF